MTNARLIVTSSYNVVGTLSKLCSSQVWFRKGLSRAKLNGQENAETGSRWVEMVGKFSLIAVGLNDQVSVYKDVWCDKIIFSMPRTSMG